MAARVMYCIRVLAIKFLLPAEERGAYEDAELDEFLTTRQKYLTDGLGVHITSGQPGRGPEITSIRHHNSFLQDRNIYVVDGQVMTVVRYCKSQAQWDKPKVVPRYLPARLGQVMAVYLVYLQPFCEYLRVHVLGGPTTDYVWADNQGPWNTDRLTRLLKRETGKALGMQLNTQRYRHTVVGIRRVVVGDNFSKGYQDDVGEGDDV
ncbi:hypothetical protein PTMSG1_02793 [Pyrenophora teres f. maculata]|nr:hypothetical protein PTMSG1_02793 [Pyrenophora teres f. maculata]